MNQLQDLMNKQGSTAKVEESDQERPELMNQLQAIMKKNLLTKNVMDDVQAEEAKVKFDASPIQMSELSFTNSHHSFDKSCEHSR